MLFQKSLRLSVGLRRAFGPVSEAPGSARAFLAEDSLCSALSRDIRCAQSGTESLATTHLQISECTRSAFRAPPPLMCFTDENNKETKWMASYRAPKTRHSTQPPLLLSASLSLLIRSFLSDPQLFFNGTYELFSSRETHAPLCKKRRGLACGNQKQRVKFSSYTNVRLRWEWLGTHKTHGLICSLLYLFMYVGQWQIRMPWDS